MQTKEIINSMKAYNHTCTVHKTVHRLSSYMNVPNFSKLECGPMPNLMAALPNIGGALCSTPQSLAGAQYWSAVQ